MKTKTIKKLKQWLKKNDFGDCNIKNGKDFEYNYENSTIYCGDYESIMEAEPTFIKLCNRYGVGDYDMPTMTILHELGHHNTGYDFSNLSNIIDIILRRLIDIIPCYNILEQQICYWCYQRIPQERAATKWACEFVLENAAATKELKDILSGD